MDKVILVKVGGATLGNHDTAIDDIVALQNQGKPLIIVHGGGKLITEWLSKRDIPSRFIEGERVTDQATLEVAISVLAGLVNKEIVSAINSRGGLAAGISGVNGALIEGRIGNIEKGYVGTVSRINTAILERLLEAGFLPVIAPVGLNSSIQPADAPKILNYNADVAAGEIAAAVRAERLIFLTDVAGITDSSGRLLTTLSPDQAEALIKSGVASGGMIPKIRACLRALSDSSTTSIIDGRQPHNLIKEIEDGDVGTTIKI